MTAPTDSAAQLFDHMAKVDGQTVHCERAAFFATGGIPYGAGDRMQLGFQIGFGMVGGGVTAAGIIALGSKVLGLVFA